MGVFDRIFNKKQDSSPNSNNYAQSVDANNVILPRTLITTPLKIDPLLTKKLLKINQKLAQTTKKQREETHNKHQHEEQRLAKELEKIEREIAILEGREPLPIIKKTNLTPHIEPEFNAEEFLERPVIKTIPKRGHILLHNNHNTNSQPTSKHTQSKSNATTINNIINSPSKISHLKPVTQPARPTQAMFTNTKPILKTITNTPNKIEKTPFTTHPKRDSVTFHKIKEKIAKVKASFQKKTTQHALPPHKRLLDQHHAPLHAIPTIKPHHLPPHKKNTTNETTNTQSNIKLNQDLTNKQLELAILELQAKWDTAKTIPLSLHPTHAENTIKVNHKKKKTTFTQTKPSKKKRK